MQVQLLHGIVGQAWSSIVVSFTDDTAASGKYVYRLKKIDNDGKYEYSKEVEINLGMPTEFLLEQNYPNPFNPTTNISYEISVNLNVIIKVYDVIGIEVAALLNEEILPVRCQVESKASNLALGVCFYSINAGEYKSIVKKVILLK